MACGACEVKEEHPRAGFAAVAIAALNGEAEPRGDAEGAIWVPTGGGEAA
jgi:hypothetical protein